MMEGLLIVVGAASFVTGCWIIAKENLRERRRQILRIRLAWECSK